MKIADFPLAWPEGLARTAPEERAEGRFRVDFRSAYDGLADEAERLHDDARRDVVVSTNVPLDARGMPLVSLGKQRVADPKMSTTEKTFAVNLWGSRPALDNDDCWTGADFATETEARACYDRVAAGDFSDFFKGAHTDVAVVELDGPGGVHAETYVPGGQRVEKRNVRDYARPVADEAWRRECAMQAGMAFGVEGYNDEMGF